jgi:hypothetical protein
MGTARAWLLGLAFSGLGLACARSAPPARWMVLADCAAAYRANAKIVDPERAASMTAQISETGDDYAKAALKAYPAAGKAKAAVEARVSRRMAAFARQPRTDVERFIDACPQLEE